MSLDIILRTCDKQNVLNNPQKRIIPEDRKDMILKVVDSIVKSANSCPEIINIKVLDDHSSSELLDKMASVLDKSFHSTQIVNLEGEGFNNSAYEQFRAGLEADDLVYFIEDDYFHCKDAIQSMLSFYRTMAPVLQQHIVVHPYDCTHRYWSIDPAKIFFHENRYWRTTTHTSNTILTHSSIIKGYWFAFEALAKEYPKVTEDNTINRLYNNLVMHGGPVSCFNPMPSVAYHMSYENEAPNIITNTFTNWKKEWDSYEWN